MNLNDTSKELFAKIRGRFPSVVIGNETAEVTNDPHAARFFDFDFKAGDKVLGKVSISISEQEGLVVIHSADLSQTEDLVARDNWFSFLKELRQFAKSRMMNFDTRDITKSNLDKRDYNFLSNMNKSKEVTEAALTGTNKTSFQKIGDSKLIIKHSAPVDADIAAGRTHRIHSMYIESSEGERFKYPFKHINGARAMARHVSEGGKPYDDFGKHIVSLSEELYKLKKFKNYVNRSSVMAETLKEYSTVINDRIEEIKETIQGLQKESFYRLTKENFKNSESPTVPEDVKENWIDELTIKTFNNELQEVFPYIYKLVTQKPIKEITAEDFETEASGFQGSTETRYLKYNVSGDFDRSRPVSDKDAFYVQELLTKAGIQSEVTPDEGNYQGIVIYTNAAPQSVEKVLGSIIETTKDPIEQFEKILDSIIDEGENSLFSSDSEEQKQALDKLNQLMSKHFPAGVNGINGLESLEGIIDDANLNDQIREIGKKDSDACIRPLIYAYIQDKKPDMLKRINTGDMKMSTEGNQFAQAVRKAKAAGMKPGDKFKVGDKEYTLKDAMEMAGISDISLEDVASMDPNQSPQARDYGIGHGEKEEVQQILNKHQADFDKVKAGDSLMNQKNLYSDLFSYYMDSGEMPYGTMKARDGDPEEWILDRLEDMGLMETVQEAPTSSPFDNPEDFANWLRKTHKKEVGQLTAQEYAIVSKQYRAEKNKSDDSFDTALSSTKAPAEGIDLSKRTVGGGLISQAKALAKKYAGDATRAYAEIEKLEKGLSDNEEVQKALQQYNEEQYNEESWEELAQEIWKNNPGYHDEYKDWQEFAKSDDFQFEVDRLRSKFESTGGGPNIRQMSDLELANFLHTSVAQVKKDREAAEEAAMELNQKYAGDNESSKEDLHKGTTKIEALVKSFYDYTTNKFPKGETAVITAVQKQYGDAAAKTAIETIKTLQSGRDMEIERIKQLAGYSTKK